MRINPERCFSLIIFVMGLVAGGMAFMLNNIARRMPLISVAFMLVSLGGYFIGEMGKKDKGGKGEEWFSTVDTHMLGWITAILPLMLVLGLLPGCSAFSTLFYRFEAKKNWKDAIIFGLLLWVSFWLIFEVGLRAELYNGFIDWF